VRSAGENVKALEAVVNVLAYTYDATRHRTTELALAGGRATWTYDRAYQLVGEARGNQVFYDSAYVYDGDGNRLTWTDGANVTTYTYDAANQLQSVVDTNGTTSYTYDADGNRIREEKLRR
jgi:YD repeat-containing protein